MNAYLSELLAYLFRLCFNQCDASLHFRSSKHSFSQKPSLPHLSCHSSYLLFPHYSLGVSEAWGGGVSCPRFNPWYSYPFHPGPRIHHFICAEFRRPFPNASHSLPTSVHSTSMPSPQALRFTAMILERSPGYTQALANVVFYPNSQILFQHFFLIS